MSSLNVTKTVIVVFSIFLSSFFFIPVCCFIGCFNVALIFIALHVNLERF